MSIAPTLIKEFPHVTYILTPSDYNRLGITNMNKVKAILHNKVLFALKSKNYNYDKIVVDQFCFPTKYYEHLKNIKRNIISKITGLNNVMLLDDDIAVLNEKLYQEKKALLNDATFKKYLNDVIYYQDSNYKIISGNELKKGLTKKKKS